MRSKKAWLIRLVQDIELAVPIGRDTQADPPAAKSLHA